MLFNQWLIYGGYLWGYAWQHLIIYGFSNRLLAIEYVGIWFTTIMVNICRDGAYPTVLVAFGNMVGRTDTNSGYYSRFWLM